MSGRVKKQRLKGSLSYVQSQYALVKWYEHLKSSAMQDNSGVYLHIYIVRLRRGKPGFKVALICIKYIRKYNLQQMER